MCPESCADVGICVITFTVMCMQIQTEIQICRTKCLCVHAGTLSQEPRTTSRMSLYEQVSTWLAVTVGGAARLPVNIQLRKERRSTLTQPWESFWRIPRDVSKSESRHAACSLEVGLFTRLLVLTDCKTSHWVRSFYGRGDSCISPSLNSAAGALESRRVTVICVPLHFIVMFFMHLCSCITRQVVTDTWDRTINIEVWSSPAKQLKLSVLVEAGSRGGSTKRSQPRHQIFTFVHKWDVKVSKLWTTRDSE